MKVIKGYVQNHNRPKGCIAKCYIAEETIEFCTEYYSNISTIGNPCEKNDHIQVGKPLSGGQHVAVDQRELVQTHLYVLHNGVEVQPYIELVSMDDEIAPSIEKDINGLTLREGKIVVEINDEGVPHREELRNKSEAGSLSFDGENDILIVALGTKEHSGQVRGMNKFITPSFFFNAIHSQYQWVKEKKSFLARISSLEETVAVLTQTASQTMGTPSSATNVDCYSSNKIQHVDGAKMIVEESNHVDGEKCALSLGEPCKLIIQQLGNVVAMRTIIEILSACILLFVDVVLDEEELLPIPHDVEGLVFLRDALGHQILWPKELIDHECIMVVPKKHKNPKSNEPFKYDEDVKNFSNLVDNFLASGVGSVFVPFEVDVFRGTYYGYIYEEELKAIKDLKELGGATICLYLR
ncbi:hypothetical protein LWI29_011464 [Acer saccharum]|uniref:DUF4218 domain-containing protein n=1 Tax=Acer saccharum TaxID=4024 RepID=A0AA39VSP6_ACESA|nr:hypothetical protein LWI29_011464 [Acer saccharum]